MGINHLAAERFSRLSGLMLKIQDSRRFLINQHQLAVINDRLEKIREEHRVICPGLPYDLTDDQTDALLGLIEKAIMVLKEADVYKTNNLKAYNELLKEKLKEAQNYLETFSSQHHVRVVYRLAIIYLEECLEIKDRQQLTSAEFNRVRNLLN